MPTTTTQTERSFADLLARAIAEPGILGDAFNAFHNYSFGNQVLAIVQCHERGLRPGPIATFPGWKAKGRFVRKGEKAIVLCMPVTIKKKATDEAEADERVFTRFVFRPNWFVLSQTEGQETPAIERPEWSTARALAALQVTEVPFEMINGNVLGYAKGRTLAVSPVAAEADATRLHELAHIVLGHTTGEVRVDRAVAEVEAESVAYLCLEALGLPGAEFRRGYIQHWNARRDSAPISESGAQRIFKAADAILRAGRPANQADTKEAA